MRLFSRFVSGVAAAVCAVSGTVSPQAFAENADGAVASAAQLGAQFGAPVEIASRIPAGISYSDYLRYGYDADETPAPPEGRAEFNRDMPFAAGEKSARDFIFLGAATFVAISAVKLAGESEAAAPAPTCSGQLFDRRTDPASTECIAREICFADKGVIRNGACVMSDCPPGEFPHNGDCVGTCPNNFSLDTNGTSDTADDSCVSMCAPNEFAHKKVCRSDCPPDLFLDDQGDSDASNNTCVEECMSPRNFVSSDRRCLPGCTGATPLENGKNCVDMCDENQFEYENICRTDDCPSGLFLDDMGDSIASNNTCVEDCDRAGDRNFEYNQTCVSDCSATDRPVNNDGVCVRDCTDPTEFEYENICRSDCPTGLFLDDMGDSIDSNNTCVSDCTTDAGNRNFEYKQTCVSDCSTTDRPVNDNGVCVEMCDTDPARPVNDNGVCVEMCDTSDSSTRPVNDGGVCMADCSNNVDNPVNDNGFCSSGCSVDNEFVHNNMCVSSCPGSLLRDNGRTRDDAGDDRCVSDTECINAGLVQIDAETCGPPIDYTQCESDRIYDDMDNAENPNENRCLLEPDACADPRVINKAIDRCITENQCTLPPPDENGVVIGNYCVAKCPAGMLTHRNEDGMQECFTLADGCPTGFVNNDDNTACILSEQLTQECISGVLAGTPKTGNAKPRNIYTAPVTITIPPSGGVAINPLYEAQFPAWKGITITTNRYTDLYEAMYRTRVDTCDNEGGGVYEGLDRSQRNREICRTRLYNRMWLLPDGVNDPFSYRNPLETNTKWYQRNAVSRPGWFAAGGGNHPLGFGTLTTFIEADVIEGADPDNPPVPTFGGGTPLVHGMNNAAIQVGVRGSTRQVVAGDVIAIFPEHAIAGIGLNVQRYCFIWNGLGDEQPCANLYEDRAVHGARNAHVFNPVFWNGAPQYFRVYQEVEDGPLLLAQGASIEELRNAKYNTHTRVRIDGGNVQGNRQDDLDPDGTARAACEPENDNEFFLDDGSKPVDELAFGDDTVVLFREEYGGWENGAQNKNLSFSLAEDGLSMEYRAELKISDNFAVSSRSGYRRANGGKTETAYYRANAIRALSPRAALYAGYAYGKVRSDFYEDAPLEGFSAGFSARRLFHPGDSYRIGIDSPLADERAKSAELSAAAFLTAAKHELGLTLTRRIQEKTATAKLYYRRQFK